MRWPDHSLVRIHEFTTILVTLPATNDVKSPLLRLDEGTIHQINRDGSSNSFRISTPHAAVGVKG